MKRYTLHVEHTEDGCHSEMREQEHGAYLWRPVVQAVLREIVALQYSEEKGFEHKALEAVVAICEKHLEETK